MNPEDEKSVHPARMMVVRVLSSVEDVVYAGIGALLAISALVLLWSGFKTVITGIVSRSLTGQLPGLLDQILFALLIVELMYTVQVSFREHGLLAEPFLVVGLIAVVRRVLVVTAELPKLSQTGDQVFRHEVYELAVLTLMIVVFVGSLVLLQRSARQARVIG